MNQKKWHYRGCDYEGETIIFGNMCLLQTKLNRMTVKGGCQICMQKITCVQKRGWGEGGMDGRMCLSDLYL